MITKFIISKEVPEKKGRQDPEDLCIPPVVPDCDMCRLHEGDVIFLGRRGIRVVYPQSTGPQEEWMMKVKGVFFEIAYFKDFEDGSSFYDVNTVVAKQIVSVVFHEHNLH